MLGNIILKEIHHHVLSLRLHLTLALVLLLFGLGTLAYIKGHAAEQEQYASWRNKTIENYRQTAEDNLSEYAIRNKNLILAPRGNAFLTDAREKYLPNQFNYSAYNVFGFGVKRGAANDYMESFQELNWAFIVALIISFAVLLFTYDCVSGEKEARTLAISLSNSVSRGVLLFGKYISAVLVTLLVLTPGFALSLVILIISGVVAVNAATLAEVGGFLAATGLLVCCMAAFGLLVSTASKHSNVSLLGALCLWLGFVVVVPNTVQFWTDKLFPIDSAAVVSERISQAKKELRDNAPDGAWSSHPNEPFYPKHELRAIEQMKHLLSEKKFNDQYTNDMMYQYERARALTWVSPVALFEHLTEAVSGGGYPRMRKVWDDLHSHQAQLLAWFKDIDAADDKSPHWYNPRENYSTTLKGVSWETVPQFAEGKLSAAERLGAASIALVLLVVFTAVAFVLSFVLFLRYDVR